MTFECEVCDFTTADPVELDRHIVEELHMVSEGPIPLSAARTMPPGWLTEEEIQDWLNRGWIRDDSNDPPEEPGRPLAHLEDATKEYLERP